MSCSQCTPNKEYCVMDNKPNTSRYLLIGSPNVGKSTYFTRATWSTATIGNVDGITVKVQSGRLKNDKNVSILDLPGIRDLSTTTLEEEIVIKTILNDNYDGAINIIAAPTLQRDLMLTCQLLEADILNEVVVNMVDELIDNEINALEFTKILGVPVNLMIARKNIGVNQSIASFLSKKSFVKPFKIDYGEKVENVISQLEEILPKTKVSQRFLAIQFFSKNKVITDYFENIGILNDAIKIVENSDFSFEELRNCIYFAKKNKINLIIQSIFKKHSISRNQKNALIASNQIRQNLINRKLRIVKKTNKYKGTENSRKLQQSKKVDKFFFKKWIIIPLFILLVAAVYYICFGKYAGGWIVDKFTEAMELGVSKIAEAMTNSGATEWAAKFVEEGLFGGIITVLGFIPYILFLHICMALLEQSGLLARVSVILDKSFERYGLSGRSVITLMTGLGCSIPSILMARNSHSKKERFITTLIAPLVACSARIVVFNWIAAAIVDPNFSWLVVLLLTIFSGVVALGMGWTFSSILFRAKQSFLLTELPPWRKPDFLAIIKSSLNEIWQFVKRVFTIIFVVNIIMFLITYLGPIAGAFIPENNDTNILDPNQTSYLGYISYGLKYLAYPLGLGGDWRIFASLIGSAPAKELAASNLELLFGSPEGFRAAIFDSTLTKLPIATVVSYFIFFTFFTPCISTDIVIKKEGGRKLLWIELISSLVVAYVLSAIAFNGIGLFELIAINQSWMNNWIIVLSLIIFILFIIANILMPIVRHNFSYKKVYDSKVIDKINYSWIGIDASLALLLIIFVTTGYSIL